MLFLYIGDENCYRALGYLSIPISIFFIQKFGNGRNSQLNLKLNFSVVYVGECGCLKLLAFNHNFYYSFEYNLILIKA